MTEIICHGKYYWQLVFDYDNSNNSGSIDEEFVIKENKVVDKKEFLKKKLNIQHNYTFNSQTSFSIKYVESVLESNLNSTNTYNVHDAIAKEYETISDTNERHEYETIHKKKYTIGPHSKLQLYMLCYETDGATVKTGIVSTSPNKNYNIIIKFNVTMYILGLNELESRLMNTFPGIDNISEWRRIRDVIIQNSTKPDEQRFLELVKVMNQTHPGSSNRVEWNDIRGTCNEILQEWSTEKQLLFIKLLKRLSTIHPSVDNKKEWGEIRSVVDNILNHLVKKSF